MNTMTAQTNAAALPQGTRLGQTALRVNNPDEMIEFYREVVGLRVLEYSDITSVLGVENVPLLVFVHDPDAPERHSASAGLFHNAFRVPSREALGDALARIREHWQLGGASDHRVSEALYLTDPEGNGVEIYRDFPREEWPMTDDGRVRISTEPLNLAPIEAAAGGETRAPAGTDIGHVHLEVSSLDAFSSVYVDILGFEVQTAGKNAMFVSAGGYHHHLGANTWNRRTDPRSGRGLVWFEVILPENHALDALRDRLDENQVTVKETADGISVRDADEIEVRFCVET